MSKLVRIFVVAALCCGFLLSLKVNASKAIDNKIDINSEQVSSLAENCSDGWRITGYFTPVESDYTTAETREIEISGVGKFSFNTDFLKVVFNEEEGFGEGWGK